MDKPDMDMRLCDVCVELAGARRRQREGERETGNAVLHSWYVCDATVVLLTDHAMCTSTRIHHYFNHNRRVPAEWNPIRSRIGIIHSSRLQLRIENAWKRQRVGTRKRERERDRVSTSFPVAHNHYGYITIQTNFTSRYGAMYPLSSFHIYPGNGVIFNIYMPGPGRCLHGPRVWDVVAVCACNTCSHTRQNE